MASLLASLLIKLGLDSGEFKSGLTVAEKDLQKATKRIEKIGKGMVSTGKTLSAAVTLPILAMGAMAIKGAQDQAAAIAQVETAITSMGNAAGRSAEQLAKNADALEMNSLIDADVILTKVTANLLTFGNVAGEVFDRAQQAAIDMAQRMGSDPQAAAIMLGKALNDPIRGITALSRVGVQLSEAQKKQIKSFVETGQAAKAQGIILAEVERQFAGAAKTAAETSPWRQATVAINQTADAFGEALLPIIPVITDWIVRLAQALGNLSPEMQTVVLVGAAVAAAFGPILVAAGSLTVALASRLVPALLAYRAGLVATAAASGTMAAASAVLATALRGLMILTGVGAAVAVLTGAYQLLTRETEDTTEASRALKDEITRAESTLDSYVTQLEGAGASTDLLSRLSAIAKGKVDALAGSYNRASVEAHRLATQTSLATIEILKVQAAISAASKVRQADLERDLRKSRFPTKFVTPEGAAIELRPRDPQREQDLVRQIAEEKRLQRLADATQDAAKEANALGVKLKPQLDAGAAAADRASTAIGGIAKAAGGAKAAAGELQSLLDRLFPEVAARREFEAQLKLIEQSKLTEIQRAEAVRALRREYLGLHRDLIATAPGENGDVDIVSQSESVADVAARIAERGYDAMEKFGEKVKTTRVQVVKSMQDMVTDIMSAFDRLANSIRGGSFLDILQSVIGVGMQLGSAGLFGKSFQAQLQKVPAYANGTNFHPGGLAVVGERGRELLNLPRGSQVKTNSELNATMRGAVQRNIVEIVDTTGLFRFKVGQQIVEASPAIMDGSARVTMARAGRQQRRRLA